MCGNPSTTPDNIGSNKGAADAKDNLLPTKQMSGTAAEELPVLKSEAYRSAGVAPQLKTLVDAESEEKDEKIKLPTFGRHSSMPRTGIESRYRCSPICNKLYDREAQEKQLLEAYHRRTRQANTKKAASELVIITGKSGQGKSHLARSLRPRVEQDGGFFITGKFNQLHSQLRPFAALEDAFRELMQQLKSRPEQTFQAMQARVTEAVGSEAAILAESFPSLRQLLSVQQELGKPESSVDNAQENGTAATDTEKPPDAQRRIALSFVRFMRAISCHHSIVWFLDDMQWTDQGSLALIEATIQQYANSSGLDGEEGPSHGATLSSGLMCLGSCRGNEVAVDHPLSVMLRGIEDSEDCTITDIRVGNLGKQALCDMVADLLMIPPSQECEQMVELIYKQTQGNALFTLHLLRSFQEDGSLFRNLHGDWDWNAGAIAARLVERDTASSDSEESLVSLLANKVRQLPTETQEILKVASCLGVEFHRDVLSKAARASLPQVLSVLKVASDLEFAVYDEQERKGQWVHDKHIEATQSLIPENEKAALHLQIAKNLAEEATPDEFSTNLLLIVNHSINGSEAIEVEDCRLKLAGLCLEAGRRIAKGSAFSAACCYFETGISLLGDGLWGDQYDLSLHLHNAAAEMAFIGGDHAKTERMVNAITQNARRFEDVLQAYKTQLLCFMSRERHEEAISLGCKVSGQLGQQFPKKVGPIGLVMDLLKTKRVLRRIDDEEILKLPPMTDFRAIGLMSIIHVMYGSLIISNVMAAPLVGFRLVRLTVRYGLSPLSSIGFGIYASVLGRLGLVEPAARYGQLALRLMEKFPLSGASPKTLCTVWGDALPASVSYRNCVDPIVESHRLGISRGATHVAMIAAFVHCAMTLVIGAPLRTLERLIVQYKHECYEYGQLFMVDMLKITLQGCRNLQSTGLVYLTGSAMVEEEMLEKVANHSTGFLWLHQIKYLLAVYFNEYEYADSLTPVIRKNMRSVVLPFTGTVQTFLQGLVSAVLAEKSRKQHRVARKRLTELKKAAKVNPDSLQNKVCLLEAELARVSGDVDSAVAKFEESIQLAHAEGYLQEQALACERAGRMLLSHQREVDAVRYLATAKKLYREWGVADRKVEQLDRLLTTKAVRISRAEEKLAKLIIGGQEATPLNPSSLALGEEENPHE
ncbi:expressed unknown protein [Seminavis robusta]|uniref:Orc1-like AAA ATPase domain-containing protein n=1 Tax=Seminavis robusta TaxID=568900 RepID=A0A9N8E1I9_9STRA|nr:expressed unknown protein [Seminavis robusta]|eukprot:Sro555_g165690.1 n/a (1159) ;mRNA; f:21536-25089